jgi:hypothetical protein
MSFIVDPQVFDAKGGLINWLTVSRRHQKAARPAEIARERGLEGIWSIQLRWGFDPALGYPIEPFVVWSKPAGQAKVPVGFVRTPFGVILNQPCEEAVLELSAPVGGFVIAYPSMPLVATPVAVVPVAAGATSVRVTGSAIRTLVIPAQFTVVDIRTPVDLADDPNWVPIEHVGLPSHRLTSVHTDLLAKQGILATGLLSPPEAALDRFRRGAPFYGWADTITSGVAVTPWQLADPKAMVEVFNDEMLPDFVDMADRAFGSAQRWLLYRRLMQVPTGSQSAEATFNPLQSVLYGGLSDPLAALILGLGTAYPWRPNDSPRLAFVSEAGVPDFMVTGTFLDDNGDKVPRACFVLGPQPLNPPPAPGGLTSTSPGLQSPTVLDGPYRAVVTTAWNHLPPVLDFAVGSQAFARWGLNPARPAQMLLEPRARDTALQPVGAAQNESTPHRRSLSDTTWEIDPTVTPNSLRYAVAHQDVFGLWSGWTHTGAAVAVPPLSRVTLTAARLDCPPPGSLPVPQGPVPAALQFDLAWDWTSRRPQTISVVGRRYAQAKANDPPGDMTPPVADTFTATGAGVLLTLEFDPDGRIITNPDGTIATVGAGLTATAEHLTIDGQQTSPLPLQDRATRRYRISLNGLVLDFAAVSRWGLALWARGQERVQPQRTTAWNTVTVLSAADPRPPVLKTVYDTVTLASMRDGQGVHQARLSWAAMDGAVAYQVYTASEATLRAYYGMPEPRASDTLTQRLAELQNRFGIQPDRRCWTRISKDAVTGTSTPVSLPRGTREIHCYLVIGVSAGNVESAWPTTADPQCGKRFVGFAAPVVVTPPPPSLEVSQVVDGSVEPASYFARLRVGCDGGARVARVDLYRTRVADAVVQVETMGPPHATITSSGAAYTVHGDADHPILRVTGRDTVGQGSWKPVFYRAVAWTADDLARGQYAGRSAPSVPRSVLVPPAGPPPLQPLVAVSPTVGSPLVRIDFATTAPVADTQLGPHVIGATAQLVADDGTLIPLELLPPAGPFSALPLTQPGAGTSGLWRDETAAGLTGLHLLVRRTDPTHRIRVRVRLTDPLGRMSEQALELPPLPSVVPPDITGPQVTAIPGGWVLTFTTRAPDESAEGAYELRVQLRRSGIIRPQSVKVKLADIPRPPHSPLTLFTASRVAIPIAASRRGRGEREVAIGFRHPGTATVVLLAPDGRTTTLTRRIEEP